MEAGLILKNGLAVLVAEKAEDGDPADKPNKLLVAAVIEGAVIPVVDGRPNKPPDVEEVVVAAAPKIPVVDGSVLTVLAEGTKLGLLLSDNACTNTPPALAGILTVDGVLKVVVLASLFSEGVALDNGRGALLAGAALFETVVVTADIKLLEIPVSEERIKALKMLVEPLPTLLEPNALPMLLDEPRFLKNPPLLGAGAENENGAGAVVVIPVGLAKDELTVVTCTLDCQMQGQLF